MKLSTEDLFIFLFENLYYMSILDILEIIILSSDSVKKCTFCLWVFQVSILFVFALFFRKKGIFCF